MTIELLDNSLPEYYTLGDLVERLSLRSQSNPSSRNTALFVRAIQDTIRQLPNKQHDWRYYHRTIRFTTSAVVSLTIDYDYTGGAQERLVTASVGEFPSSAEYGEIRIGDVNYKIHRRLSATEVTLHPDDCPTEDLADTDVEWQQADYRLPRRISKIRSVVNKTNTAPLTYMSPQDFYEADTITAILGYPSRYTLTNVGNAGETGIRLSPAPSEAQTYEVTFTCAPAIPTVVGVNGSDGSITAGGTTFTSENASFNSKLIGCLIRFSHDADYPVGTAAGHKWQAFVVGVPSSTALTLSEPYTATESGLTYSISSPIDIDVDVMLGYVESEAFAQYCRNHKHESLPDAMSLAAMDLREAIAHDSKVDRSRGMDSSYTAQLWGYRNYAISDD